MKTGWKRVLAFIMSSASVLIWTGTAMGQPKPVGQWDFNDAANLIKATVGNDLELSGSQRAIPGLNANDGAVLIGTGSYYRALHGIAPNGGGAYVNQYTAVFDIKLPSLNKWYALLNTNAANSNEADIWINLTGNLGVGDTGYSTAVVTAGFWHRATVSVDLAAGTIDYYLDGQAVQTGKGLGVDGRFALYSTNDTTPWLVLFGDSAGNDSPILVSMVSIYDVPLTAAQVAALKGPGGESGPVEGLPVSITPPAIPGITSVVPANPTGLDTVTLTASAFKSPDGNTHAKSNWQLSVDSSFANDWKNNKFIYRDISSDKALTQLTLENSVLPFGVTLYARVQYVDSAGNVSDYSAPVSFTLKPFADLNVLFAEDFESTPVDSLPPGWKAIDFTDDASTLDNLTYYHPQLKGWSVQEDKFLRTLSYYPGWGADRPEETPADYETGVPIVENKSAHADSGNYASASVLYEAHLLSPVYDFTGITDVVLTFNSDYVQNQDNIAALEYTVNGGDLGANGQASGKWLPIAYFLEPADILTNDQGKVDADLTLAGIADGTSLTYGDFVFAKDSAANIQDLAPYFFARIDDGLKDGKRFEKFRLTAADNQSKVRFLWTFMGTWSWYWGIDNVKIWGKGGKPTPVQDWSLF